MIYAKLDVVFDVHPKFIKLAAKGRLDAVAYWCAVLTYLRRNDSKDGLIPSDEIGLPLHVGDEKALDLCQALVEVGLFERQKAGYLLARYSEKNETSEEIEKRRASTRDRVARYRNGRGTGRVGNAGNGVTDVVTDHVTDDVTTKRTKRYGTGSVCGSVSGSGFKKKVAPKSATAATGDHSALIDHFSNEFERLKGVRPEIGAKGGAGAKRLLTGRTLAEAKAIVDKALADPWLLENAPDLAAIAGKVNAYIGNKTGIGSTRPGAAKSGWVQPVPDAGPLWKSGDGT